jgi:rhodanese-related sulfurtransferase
MKGLSLQFVTRLGACLVMALWLAACSQEAPPEKAATTATPATQQGDISAQELNERILAGSAPLILDVRSEGEFAEGHLPGAVNIIHSQFVDAPEGALAALGQAKDAEIVVHCFSGRRASIVEDVLVANGYSNIRHLAGDWQGWQAAGYETVQP